VSKAEIGKCKEEDKNAFLVRYFYLLFGEKGKVFSHLVYLKASESLHPLALNETSVCSQLCRPAGLAVRAPGEVRVQSAETGPCSSLLSSGQKTHGDEQ